MRTTIGNAETNFPPLLHLSYILQQSADKLLLNEAGVGLSQVRIMSVLHPNIALSQRAIAISLGQTEANVSRQLKAMKKQGLVHISRSKKDARQREVTLTSKGSTASKKADKLLKNQQDQLLRLLAKNELQAFERAAQNLSKTLV